MTLSREDRMELVEDLLTRMVERGLLLTVQDIRNEIDVTCSGADEISVNCEHSSSDACGCDTSGIVTAVDELNDRVASLEQIIQTHHFIVKSVS